MFDEFLTELNALDFQESKNLQFLFADVLIICSFYSFSLQMFSREGSVSVLQTSLVDLKFCLALINCVCFVLFVGFVSFWYLVSFLFVSGRFDWFPFDWFRFFRFVAISFQRKGKICLNALVYFQCVTELKIY